MSHGVHIHSASAEHTAHSSGSADADDVFDDEEGRVCRLLAPSSTSHSLPEYRPRRRDSMIDSLNVTTHLV
jgi:hypothetical protein